MNSYDFIKNRPRRNCRGETLIRLLNATSYPKAFFSNLCMAFTEAMEGKDNVDVLIETSNELRNLERSYSMVDFARNIELIKDDERLNLNLNVIKFNAESNTIDDSEINLNTLINFNLLSKSLDVSHLPKIIEEILMTFYLSQRRDKNKGINFNEASWFLLENDNYMETNYNAIHQLLRDTLLDEIFNIIIGQKFITIKDLNVKITLKDNF